MLSKASVLTLLGVLCVASATPLRIHDASSSILETRQRLFSMSCEACEKSMGDIVHLGIESGWMVPLAGLTGC